MKQTSVLLILILCVGCRISDFAPKPIEVNGLGSLSILKDKELQPKELVKIVQSAAQEKVVSDDDARAMVAIYQKYIEEFYVGSLSSGARNEIIGTANIERYLTLILLHQDLRDELQNITFSESEKMIENRIDFADKNSAFIANNVGVFIKVFTDAYKNVIEKDEDKKEISLTINARKKIILLTAFEAAANSKVDNESLSKEERNKAGQFLKDLRNYNDQLEDSEKILDANGRLVNMTNATERQPTRFQEIVNGIADSSMKDRTKAQSAATNLQRAMGYTALQMGIDVK